MEEERLIRGELFNAVIDLVILIMRNREKRHQQ